MANTNNILLHFKNFIYFVSTERRALVSDEISNDKTNRKYINKLYFIEWKFILNYFNQLFHQEKKNVMHILYNINFYNKHDKCTILNKHK